MSDNPYPCAAAKYPIYASDGGFFVFGDISCRNLGHYRLQFNLFDFDKYDGTRTID